MLAVGALELEPQQAAFSQFDEMCQRVEQAEAEADALMEITGFDENEDTLMDMIQSQVDKELAQLKVKAEASAE